MSFIQVQSLSNASNKLDDSMIPAINIVFLLLIFFMIAGQIQATNDQLIIPKSVSDAAIPEQAILVNVMADGRYYINEQAIDSSLIDALRALGVSSNSTITCHLHKDLPVTALDPVLQAVRLLGVEQLHLATEQSA
jgi:biopolymer transport protein ExbD